MRVLSDLSEHFYAVCTLVCLLVALLDVLFSWQIIFINFEIWFYWSESQLTQVVQIAALCCGPVVANFSSFSRFIYGPPPQLFLLISHSSIFSPFGIFLWGLPVFSGSLICQTALCFLEYICVSQTGNCWTLYRTAAALTHIFAFVLNHNFL